jgi:hypothetical protein
MSIEILYTAWFKGDPFAPRGKHSPRLTAYLRRMRRWALERRLARVYGDGVVQM